MHTLEENPGLFLLYVQWGVGHLRCIDDCIARLGSHSNLNLLDAISALQIERQKLVEGQDVYKVADAILTGVRNKSGNFRVDAANIPQGATVKATHDVEVAPLILAHDTARADEGIRITALALESFVKAPGNLTDREKMSYALDKVARDIAAWVIPQ